MVENWKDIPEYEGVYQVSDNVAGEVVKGYKRVKLFFEGGGKRYMVHVLVMRAFVGPKPEGMQVNHKNGDKKDCNLANLEYVTCSDNQLHSVRILGRPNPQGSKHGGSKLREPEVLRIRELRRNGDDLATIAELFCVSVPTVSMICTGKTWRHI